MASDASEQGYGVCSALWPRHEVAAVGRVLERARFKRVGSHQARESALTGAGFVKDRSGRWHAAAFGEENPEEGPDTTADVHEGWEVDPEFPEVPPAGLRTDLWEARLWGPWHHVEDILVLEARVLVKSMRRVAVSVFGRNIRQLFLVDNMSVCLSFARSRCRDFKLLVQIRKFSAYCLARNIAAAVRWIPSELNKSDEPVGYLI